MTNIRARVVYVVGDMYVPLYPCALDLCPPGNMRTCTTHACIHKFMSGLVNMAMFVRPRVCVCMRRRTLVQWVYLCARTHTCACLHILKAVTADAHARILFSRRSHVRTDRHLCISLPTSRRACHDNVLAREISPVRGVICASLLQSFVRFWQFESGGLLLSHEAVYRGQGQRKSNYFSLTRSESRGTSLPARDVFC